jgi:hypothetical protein
LAGEDFTIELNLPSNRISFNTYLNNNRPATVTITTVDNVQTEYVIDNDPLTVGFFGLASLQKIKSIRWVSAYKQAYRTGISDLKTDVIASTPEPTTVLPISTASASTFWNADPPSDAIDGLFGDNVYS